MPNIRRHEARNMSEHHHGLLYLLASAVMGFFSWFLEHVQVIDSVLQFLLLCISITGALVGLRKVLK